MQCIHCGGLVQDGFCEDCGKPAGSASAVAPGLGGLDAEAPATTSTSSRTRNSTRFTVNYPTRSAGKGASKPTRRRAGVSTSTTTRRNALGGGLFSLPDLPSQDPLKLLMAAPEVPAHKRHCPKCDAKVNRSAGYCPACGSAYDFQPRLKAGDVVAGKYEVKGPIAFGGLGWIYLGWDQVLARWVVLKGLLNANDESSAAAAVAERRYLAAVKHPKIVGIYDFVNHGAEGFIIMEFVGGLTVQSLRKRGGPLPVAEAAAYILGILPAFAYLHAQGLVYCDFKPDNVMLEYGDVKLIDMGAVRKIGDPNGDIYATVGFAAPEADDNPTAVSDLFTLGRALAVLIMDFKFTSEHEHSLPTPDQEPVLAQNETLYRFLLRATHVDPDERFQTADEMADQLFGVLREIVALQSGPKPFDSKIFTADSLRTQDVRTLLSGPDVLSLPSLRVNLEDRSANEVIRILSLMDTRAQLDELEALIPRYGDRAREPRLRLADLLVRTPGLAGEGRDTRIATALDTLEAEDPFDWRPQWLRGLHALTQGRGKDAVERFERVYFELPGELAPRLAMGVAYEAAGQHDQALPYYDRVGAVDPVFVIAHLGAARCLARSGELDQSVQMLQRVPSNHALHTASQLCVAELLLAHPTKVSAELLRTAERAIQPLLPAGGAANSFAARLLAATVGFAKRLGWSSHETFLGRNCDEKQLRLGAEEQFRKAAKQLESDVERFALIASANAVRPVTLF